MSKLWTDQQTQILKDNYFAKGAAFVANATGKSVCAVKDRAARMGVKGNHRQLQKILQIPEEDKKLIRTLILRERLPRKDVCEKFELSLHVVSQVLAERVDRESMFA